MLAEVIPQLWCNVLLALPISLVVAVVYKATKIDKPAPLILQSLKLFAYIVLGMAGVGLALYGLTQWWPESAVP